MKIRENPLNPCPHPLPEAGITVKTVSSQNQKNHSARC